MKTVRIIPRLDIKGPNLVKGIHLEGLRVLGKPSDFAKYYYDEVMEYIGMTPEYFHELCDKFRSPHLWAKTPEGNWKLRHDVAGKGLED